MNATGDQSTENKNDCDLDRFSFFHKVVLLLSDFDDVGGGFGVSEFGEVIAAEREFEEEGFVGNRGFQRTSQKSTFEQFFYWFEARFLGEYDRSLISFVMSILLI